MLSGCDINLTNCTVVLLESVSWYDWNKILVSSLTTVMVLRCSGKKDRYTEMKTCPRIRHQAGEWHEKMTYSLGYTNKTSHIVDHMDRLNTFLNCPTCDVCKVASTNIFVQGDSKKMSPLAFKSNNSRPMRYTTLQDMPFERADNFLSNECIHTRFPFPIALSEASNQKLSGFCVLRFRRTGRCVLSSLYRI